MELQCHTIIMKFLWPDRFRHTFAILPVILYAEDKIVFDSAQSAAMEEVNSMNNSYSKGVVVLCVADKRR